MYHNDHVDVCADNNRAAGAHLISWPRSGNSNQCFDFLVSNPLHPTAHAPQPPAVRYVILHDILITRVPLPNLLILCQGRTQIEGQRDHGRQTPDTKILIVFKAFDNLF